ncbi:MAG: hypothetical protein D6702_10280 [Planctomycetota bacterium]|nr:MAG: hypothetical protein D6702_10280 [Planctomycetota bacterium]
MKTKLLLVSLIAVALLPACAGLPTTVRGGYSITATGALFDDHQTTIAGRDTNTDLSDLGLRVEAFASPETSFFAALHFREYDFGKGSSADGNELHFGGRYYFLADQPLQPFLQGGFFYGDQLDFAAGPSSGGYAGAAIGGGAVYYLSRSALAEAGLRYDSTLSHPDRAGSEYELAGWSGWFGLGMTF